MPNTPYLDQRIKDLRDKQEESSYPKAFNKDINNLWAVRADMELLYRELERK